MGAMYSSDMPMPKPSGNASIPMMLRNLYSGTGYNKWAPTKDGTGEGRLGYVSARDAGNKASNINQALLMMEGNRGWKGDSAGFDDNQYHWNDRTDGFYQQWEKNLQGAGLTPEQMQQQMRVLNQDRAWAERMRGSSQAGAGEPGQAAPTETGASPVTKDSTGADSIRKRINNGRVTGGSRGGGLLMRQSREQGKTLLGS